MVSMLWISEWECCTKIGKVYIICIPRQFQIEDKDNLTVWRVVLMKTHLDKDIEID